MDRLRSCQKKKKKCVLDGVISSSVAAC